MHETCCPSWNITDNIIAYFDDIHYEACKFRILLFICRDADFSNLSQHDDLLTPGQCVYLANPILRVLFIREI